MSRPESAPNNPRKYRKDRLKRPASAGTVLRRVVGALLLMAIIIWPAFTVRYEHNYELQAMQREVVALPPRMDNSIKFYSESEPLPQSQFTTTLTISAMGDCVLGSDPQIPYEGSLPDELASHDSDYSWCFKRVLPYIGQDDATIINLEAPFTESEQRADNEFCFKGDPKYADILTTGSVELVSLGNNHIFDYGDDGFNSTISTLNNANIGFAGNGISYINQINGVRVGFLSYYNTTDDAHAMINDIARLKKSDCELIICSLHWGEEYSSAATAEQQVLGRAAIDAGADIVLGTHPHVIGPIELYKDKYIVYSLGNFTFGGSRTPSDYDTFIFQQTFNIGSDGVTNGGIRIVPCSISSVGDHNNYQPMPYEQADAERVLARINEYSAALEYGVNFSTDILSRA